MKTRLFGMLAAVLLSVGATAQSEDFALGNFDHEVTQPAPGGNHERVFSLRFPCVEESKSETGGVIKIHLRTNR